MPETPVVLHTRVVSGTGGGPDKTILNSPRFLDPSEYRVLCAYMYPPDDPGFEQLRARAREWEAPLLPVPDRGPWDWRVASELLKICRRERVTVWHGHDYKSNLLGLILRPLWPMRLVTTVHGWVDRRVRLYYGIDRLCLRHYERVICVSEDLLRNCLESGVPEPRCLHIDNAIDTRQFSRRLGLDEAKARVGIAPGRKVIGAVGRLAAEKGFDVLIRAVDGLIRAGEDVELLIAGEGGEEPRLRSLIRELGRDDRIRLLGFRADTRELYQAMDVFALSSYREGLPNVVLEAMALEVPIVATRVAGVPRLVEHGEAGLLVEPGSAGELAGALGRVLGDPGLASRLGLAGRATIEARFSFEVRMAKIKRVYDELLGRGEIPTLRGERLPA